MGRVGELWYEPHWTIRPRWYGDGGGSFITAEGDDPAAFISYYEVARDSKVYRVEVGDVLHFRDGLDPSNPRCGLSGLNAILRELYGDEEAANYFARLLGGSGVPPFVLMLDKDLHMEQEDVERIEEKAYRKTTGDQKGRPLVLYGGTDMKQLSFSPKDMDMRSVRYLAEERFSAVTGIPAVVLEFGAGSEHSIYNNVKQAMERAVESYLVPLWRHVEEELNVQLLPDFESRAGRYCRYDLSQVRALQEDEDAKSARKVKEYQGGIIMRSEARSALGYGPSVEGDEEADRVFYSPAGPVASEPEDDEGNDAPAPVKSLPEGKPSDEEVSEAVDWWDANAPEGARGVLSAKVTGNGNGAKR